METEQGYRITTALGAKPRKLSKSGGEISGSLTLAREGAQARMPMLRE